LYQVVILVGWAGVRKKERWATKDGLQRRGRENNEEEDWLLTSGRRSEKEET